MDFYIYRDDIKDIGLYKHVDLSSDYEMDIYLEEENKNKPKVVTSQEGSIIKYLNKDLESIAMVQNSLHDIKFLLPFKNLKNICVRDNFLDQDLFQDLQKFPLLEELDISCNFSGPVDIKELTKLKLKSLSISFNDIGDEGFEHISKISTLEHLSCTGTNITRQSLFLLNRLTNVKVLCLCYNDFCNGSDEPLPNPTVKFDTLCITYSNISEKDRIVLKGYADEYFDEGEFCKKYADEYSDKECC